jgi:hypothetical protein
MLADTRSQASINAASVQDELRTNELILRDYGHLKYRRINDPRPEPTLESDEEWQAMSAESKNKLDEAHEHLKAAKAILEGLHGGLADGSEEEGRSDDAKSVDEASRDTRSRTHTCTSTRTTSRAYSPTSNSRTRASLPRFISKSSLTSPWNVMTLSNSNNQPQI